MSFAPEPLCYEAAATPRALFKTLVSSVEQDQSPVNKIELIIYFRVSACANRLFFSQVQTAMKAMSPKTPAK